MTLRHLREKEGSVGAGTGLIDGVPMAQAFELSAHGLPHSTGRFCLFGLADDISVH